MLKNENIAELKQKHTIIYEIDWKNDIDCEKSPLNELKEAKDYLEFICENGEKIPGSDFQVISGDLAVKDGYWECRLKEQAFYKNIAEDTKIFSAVLPFKSQYDILNINFQGTAAQNFKIFLYGDGLYQIKKDLQSGVFESKESYQKRLATLQEQSVAFDLEQKNNFSILIGNVLCECLSFKYSCQDASSFHFDYKSGKVNINKQNWRKIHDVDFDELKYLEIVSIFKNNPTSPPDSTFCVYNTMYAKNIGYIYLKPITLFKGAYKIFLYHTGELCLEYYTPHSTNWKLVPDKLHLTKNLELHLRIKMNAGDRLHDLFIAKD